MRHQVILQAQCPYVDTTTTVYCPTGAGPATCTASSTNARPSDIGGKQKSECFTKGKRQ